MVVLVSKSECDCQSLKVQQSATDYMISFYLNSQPLTGITAMSYVK